MFAVRCVDRRRSAVACVCVCVCVRVCVVLWWTPSLPHSLTQSLTQPVVFIAAATLRLRRPQASAIVVVVVVSSAVVIYLLLSGVVCCWLSVVVGCLLSVVCCRRSPSVRVWYPIHSHCRLSIGNVFEYHTGVVVVQILVFGCWCGPPSLLTSLYSSPPPFSGWRPVYFLYIVVVGCWCLLCMC